MPFDDLHCSYDKVSRCVELNIDVLVDDSPANIRRAIEENIVAATILHPWNQDVCDEEPVICAARLGRARAPLAPGAVARQARRLTCDTRAHGRGGAHDAERRLERGRPSRGPARLSARDRARAPGQRLGPLGARRGPDRPHGRRLPVPPVVPLRGRGHRERARRGRRADRVQPLGRAAARRGHDRQGDQGGASAPAAGAPHRRALLQGLPGLLDAAAEDRRRGGASGQRAAPALRRGAARAGVPGGSQGNGEALQGPLPPAALRPRRLRRGRDARARADRARRGRRRRGVDAGLRAAQAAAAPDRADLLPDHADVAALRPARDGRLPPGQVQDPLPGARADRQRPRRPSHGRTRAWCRRSPTTCARRSRRSCWTWSASAGASGSVK